MKWALILGASGGIGQQLVKDLAQSGWSLYLQGNHQVAHLQHQAKELHKKYPQQEFLVIASDFTQTDALVSLLNNIFTLDAIIAAQGITDYAWFNQQSDGEVECLIRINLTTPLLIIKHLQDKLAQSPNGRIILLGSVYGSRGSALEVTYSATKGALSAFAQAYAQEVASLNITVNVLAPGAVATPMNQQFSQAAQEELIAEIPAGRLANPKDISYWVQTLLKPESQYVTGQTFYITGGWLK